jgi:hypothetical protein
LLSPSRLFLLSLLLLLLPLLLLLLLLLDTLREPSMQGAIRNHS